MGSEARRVARGSRSRRWLAGRKGHRCIYCSWSNGVRVATIPAGSASTHTWGSTLLTLLPLCRNSERSHFLRQ